MAEGGFKQAGSTGYVRLGCKPCRPCKPGEIWLELRWPPRQVSGIRYCTTYIIWIHNISCIICQVSGIGNLLNPAILGWTELAVWGCFSNSFPSADQIWLEWKESDLIGTDANWAIKPILGRKYCRLWVLTHPKCLSVGPPCTSLCATHLILQRESSDI